MVGHGKVVNMHRHLSPFARLAWLLACCLGLAVTAQALQIPGSGKKSPTIPGAPEPPPLSDAEQVARLRRSIEATRKRLADLSAEVANPQSEYTKAEAEFQKVDETLERKQKALAAIADDGTPPKEKARAKIQAEIQALEKSWTLAKDRFDLAIEERKTLKDQIATLEAKIKGDQETFDKLSGTADPEKQPTEPSQDDKREPSAAAPSPSPAPAQPRPQPQTKTKTAEPAIAIIPTTVPAASTKDKPPSADKPREDEQAKAEADAEERANDEKKEAEERDDEELTQAKAEEKEKEEAVAEATREQETIAERLESLNKAITLEQKLVSNARRQSDNAQQSRTALSDEFRTRTIDGAPPAELRDLTAQVRDAERRCQVTSDDVREHVERLSELEAERIALLSQEVAAQKKKQDADAELTAAESHVESLRNPLHPRNLLPWLMDHGPRLLAIVLGMVGIYWSIGLFTHRIIRVIARSTARGSADEREDRAKTLVGVFHNAGSLAILGAGGTMLFQEVGVPVAPLLGGAAVFGLAVAFGAQNLIRDYFYGFVILMENQYKLNDVIKLGEVSGQVERITLRMTVLRDDGGAVHFIPNGQIHTVANMTHGWSRAVIELGVGYKEDVDRVMDVLVEIGQELRQDPAFAGSILEDPTMLGVDALTDTAVVIKFYIKTRTLKQWAVRREMLRRIKRRFDDLGIEIPYPKKSTTARPDEPATAPPPPRIPAPTVRMDLKPTFPSGKR